MNNKTAIFMVCLLMAASFLTGSSVAKKKYGGGQEGPGEQGGQGTPTPVLQPTLPPFVPKTKSAKPEVKFFVMSFCPFGNQAEAGLEPVYQLLKDKVSWQPRYIVNDKKASCEQGCPFRVYNDEAKSRCEEAVDQGEVKDMETCKNYFPYQSAEECLRKECASIRAGEFDSLHGEQELNQDVREILAYNQLVEAGEKTLGTKADEGILGKWWKFVSLVNDKCNSNNADTCWLAQAKSASLNFEGILAEAKTKAKAVLAKEVEESQKYGASGSPTVYINETLYNGGRSPEDYKKAICAAFENSPSECSQTLGQESSAVNSEDCGN